MMTSFLTLLVLSGPVHVPEPVPMRHCVVACRVGMSYSREVRDCWYDVQAECARFQPECRDEGDVVCHPRVVSLGTWDPRPAPSDPVSYNALGSLPVPPGSTLPLMGP